MTSELDNKLAAILEHLVAPGSQLELATIERFGRSMPMFRQTPPSLPAMFAHFCAQHAESDFIVDGDVRLTFGETHALARRVASGLITRHAIAKGDRVGIAARNSASWIVAYMGVLMAGGCASLLNGWASGEELAEAIALADCALVLADAPRAERLTGHPVAAPLVVFDHGDPAQGLWPVLADTGVDAVLPDLAPDDLATILFTSGSTGASKGAYSDHLGVVSGAMNYAAQTLLVYTYMGQQGNAPTGQPCALVNVPLFHVTGEVPVLLQSFVLGRKLVLMPKWDAREAMRLIQHERVTYFVGVPLMSYEIAMHPARGEFDLTSCLTFAAGGAPRPAEHVGRIRENLPHAFPILGYGLTETNGVGCGNFNENHLAKPASTGSASLPLVDLAIIGADGAILPQGEPGEVAIRSIANFLGYWNNPEATAAAVREDGYFLTGDLGYLDDAGYLFIVDRKKDIIIRGGENIASLEVEQAIYAHPAIAEASVFGLPDERFGEVPVAACFAKPGQAVTEEELRAHVAACLAPFKVPVRFFLWDQPLPRLGTEKIDKRTLRTRYAKDRDGAEGSA